MKFLTSCLLSLALFSSALSQERAMPLWPAGKTPFANPTGPEAEKSASPSLTRYPAEDGNGAAIVICPGGGYGGLARDHEGRQIAKWHVARGISAFVLTYRLGSQGHHFPAQLADVQRAIRLVRAKAGEWKVDPNRIGVIGFSAGGHLASMAATKFRDEVYRPVDEVDQVSARPDFAVLCYPVILMDSEATHQGSRRNLLGPEKMNDPEARRQVSTDRLITAGTPPVFLFHTDEDRAVRPENSIEFYLGLKKHGIPAELHLYQNGPHGVGLFQGDPILGSWSQHLNNWLRSNGWLVRDLKRAAVSGSVTLDGKPVSWGTVTFHPADKNLPVVTVRIRRGKFSAPAASGPPLGKAAVSFSGSIWEATEKPEDELVVLEKVREVEISNGATFEWSFTTN